MFEMIKKFASQADVKNTINTNLPNLADPSATTVTNVLNWVYGVTGLIAVVIIVIAGFSYATSNGDPNKAGKATKTIIFAVVGLIIIILAAAITYFVSSNVQSAMP